MRVLDSLPDLQRSTGCTEPASVALAAALAARAAGGAPWWITVSCDRGTFRNGQLSGVPGAAGRAGLDLAAALGALAGDPDQRLDVVAGVSPEDVDAAAALVALGAVSVVCSEDKHLAIYVRVETDRGTGEVSVRGDHTRVVALVRDGAMLPLPTWTRRATGAGARPPATFLEALAQVAAMQPDDEAQLVAGLAMNVTAAQQAGYAPSTEPAELAGAMASAASYARMTGQRVTVMTSGWSGNQGLVATLPIHVVAERVGASRVTLARALATSHLVGGLLREAAPSPICHALVAACAGAAAGCALLLGGDAATIERACHLAIASAGAPACDGAKPACSRRVGLAAAQAVRSARRALDGPVDGLTGGLVGYTLDETARLLARAASRLTAGEAVDGGGPPCHA